LGQSEPELLDNIDRVVQTLVRYERQSRETLLEPRRRSAMEDHIWRSWGLLRHARLISYDETMSHLSHIRLGLQLGLPISVKPATLNHLMLVTQPAQQAAAGAQPLDSGRLAALRTMMRRVVTSGTAAGAHLPAGTLGKTGTAEFGADNPPQTHAWFVGYRRNVAFAMLVEGGGVGGRVAAPLAAAFLRLLS